MDGAQAIAEPHAGPSQPSQPQVTLTTALPKGVKRPRSVSVDHDEPGERSDSAAPDSSYQNASKRIKTDAPDSAKKRKHRRKKKRPVTQVAVEPSKGVELDDHARQHEVSNLLIEQIAFH